MKPKFRTCGHIKDNGVRCGSPAIRKQMFCFNHFRLYDGTNLPGDPEYCMPVLDSYQSIQLMNVHVVRAYLAGTINDRQMTNLNHSLRLALQTQRRTREPYPGDVARELSPIMADVLGLDLEVVEKGLLTHEMDPNCDESELQSNETEINEPEVFEPQHPLRPTPETLESVREAIRNSPGLTEILKRAEPEEKAG